MKALPVERAELIERLRSTMPQAMRERPQWLLWRYEDEPGRPKPLKVPYWANGSRRRGTQGDEKDRRELAPLDVVLDRLGRGLRFDGAGFAFLPGDGLIGIDVDGAVDPETGEMSALCRTVVEACSSYTEMSPSGRGLHVIVAGETDVFKSDDIGLEVFSSKQYFTCTGLRKPGAPAEVAPVPAEALAWMREQVEAAKARAAQAPSAGLAVVQAPAVPSAVPSAAHPTPPAPSRPVAAASATTTQPPQGDDFKAVNTAALQVLDAWVPQLFASAKKCKGGYRITSKSLGRDLQEDLQVMPEGVMDFGEDCGLSPIDCVMRWQPGASTAKDALHWLAARVGVVLKRRAHLKALPGGKAQGAISQASPAGQPAAPPAPSSEESAADATDGPGSGAGGSAKKRPPEFWDRLDYLRDNFALIYGTDTVYDCANGVLMKISNMSHAYGSDLVKYWKGSSACDTRSAGGRWTVMPQRLVFDPSEAVDADTHINLFRGFKIKPMAGDVEPMLELVRYLLSGTASTPEGCDENVHWLLCWLAYPLQNLGAKLRTAVVMHGDEGAGKNFLTDLIVAIYGEYGTTVGQDELEDKHNDWRSHKQFVVGDEVSSRAELVHNKNRLKALITSATVQINPKHLARREEENHINVWFNSNELQPLALDNSDRRYFVAYTPGPREFEFYQRLKKWRDGDGAAKFFNYLLQYPCDGFDPYAPAPITEAKRDLIDLNRKSPERFWIEWSEGTIDLPYQPCSLAQGYRAYLKYAQRTGDRFPIQRPLFTRMVLRISDTLGRACHEKVMKVDYGPAGVEGQGKATRMLLTLDPPAEGIGKWASECVRVFEAALRRYMGVRLDSDEEGGAM